ncbi:hypothetical protein QPX14_09975 [Corynebacterium pseudodiphtheriticum]|uniref:hypothetical protein n=1 Tax=Corynebacterium pseudodiphtheriticum TaxID=37637 RepID=UPI00254359B7|nr:hypothetical protein [Corynebacterium pseudodiphtheriticum]MDK4289039.1 hypothetical protein [Corynebacterium pseudodiphtheriticum]
MADPSSLPCVSTILEYLTMLYPEQLVDTHVIAIISTNSEPYLKDWRNALGSLTWITAGSDGYAQPVTDLLGSINVESPQNRQLKPHVDVDYVRVRRGKRFLQGGVLARHQEMVAQ